MDAPMIVGLVILSLVAALMVLIGLCQAAKKDGPVGFYNVGEPPKKEEISDIAAWNRKHGLIWIAYGACIELGFWLGWAMPGEMLQMVCLLGGILLPLPFMVLRHHQLEKAYQVK